MDQADSAIVRRGAPARHRRKMELAGFGIAIGVVAAFALTRVLTSLLYGIAPSDPLTFAGVIGLLGAVALPAN